MGRGQFFRFVQRYYTTTNKICLYIIGLLIVMSKKRRYSHLTCYRRRVFPPIWPIFIINLHARTSNLKSVAAFLRFREFLPQTDRQADGQMNMLKAIENSMLLRITYSLMVSQNSFSSLPMMNDHHFVVG